MFDCCRHRLVWVVGGMDEDVLVQLVIVSGLGLEEADVLTVDELISSPIGIGLERLLAAEVEPVAMYFFANLVRDRGFGLPPPPSHSPL